VEGGEAGEGGKDVSEGVVEVVAATEYERAEGGAAGKTTEKFFIVGVALARGVDGEGSEVRKTAGELLDAVARFEAVYDE
jgi:hypothetical protein